MTKGLVRLVLVATMAVAGCATQTQMLDTKQDAAMQTALVRGKFDLSCPQATAQILSREVTQPAIQGPLAVRNSARRVYGGGGRLREAPDVSRALSAGRRKLLCGRSRRPDPLAGLVETGRPYFSASFSTCPPNSKRIAESSLAAKSASPRELKRS